MQINGLKINVKCYGNKKGQPVVFLHGWGGSIKTMEPIGDGLKDKYQIILIDLPGFGESDEPKEVLSVYDYADYITMILKELKIDEPIIMGHSFGGRIAIIYASENKVQKLVLSGSPYKKTQRKSSLKVRFLKTLAKISFLKKLANKMKNKMGSTDYKAASPMMKQVLVKAIHEDLSDLLSKIKAPTLLIWGSLDEEVSLNDAYDAEKIIPNAGLVIYQNGSHYAYLEETQKTITILKEFFKNKGE